MREFPRFRYDRDSGVGNGGAGAVDSGAVSFLQPLKGQTEEVADGIAEAMP